MRCLPNFINISLFHKMWVTNHQLMTTGSTVLVLEFCPSLDYCDYIIYKECNVCLHDCFAQACVLSKYFKLDFEGAMKPLFQYDLILHLNYYCKHLESCSATWPNFLSKYNLTWQMAFMWVTFLDFIWKVCFIFNKGFGLFNFTGISLIPLLESFGNTNITIFA